VPCGIDGTLAENADGSASEYAVVAIAPDRKIADSAD
jgi:hypothetical protein